jgi:hypothetical protein
VSIIAALLISSCSRGDEVNSLVKVYYVPIGVETYTPITVESIEGQGSYAELKTTDKRYRKLMSIIDDASAGVFDEKAVRVKIVTDGEAIYIDNTGGVKRSHSTGKLASRKLSAAKKLLESVPTK